MVTNQKLPPTRLRRAVDPRVNDTPAAKWATVIQLLVPLLAALAAALSGCTTVNTTTTDFRPDGTVARLTQEERQSFVHYGERDLMGADANGLNIEVGPPGAALLSLRAGGASKFSAAKETDLTIRAGVEYAEDEPGRAISADREITLGQLEQPAPGQLILEE